MPSALPEWGCVPGPAGSPYHVGPDEVGITRNGGVYWLFTKRDMLGMYRAIQKALVENPDAFTVQEVTPVDNPFVTFNPETNAIFAEEVPNWEAPDPEFNDEPF